jgi:predicted RNA binding protein YcfA (HicA-like mRNA interferase family)
MNSKALIGMLEANGWRQVRQESTHCTFKHPENKLILTVPHPKKDLPKETVQRILRDAGLK